MAAERAGALLVSLGLHGVLCAALLQGFARTPSTQPPSATFETGALLLEMQEPGTPEASDSPPEIEPVELPPPPDEVAAVEPPRAEIAPEPSPAPLSTVGPMPLGPAAFETTSRSAAPARPKAAAAAARGRSQSVGSSRAGGGRVEEYTPPSYRSSPAPPYPPEADRLHLSGVVVLMVQVGEGGEVLGVRVRHSSGHALLDDAARQAVLHWRFAPARRGARALASAVEVPVRFRVR